MLYNIHTYKCGRLYSSTWKVQQKIVDNLSLYCKWFRNCKSKPTTSWVNNAKGIKDILGKIIFDFDMVAQFYLYFILWQLKLAYSTCKVRYVFITLNDITSSLTLYIKIVLTIQWSTIGSLCIFYSMFFPLPTPELKLRNLNRRENRETLTVAEM